MGSNTGSRILILDCGSQFTQLIARRVREANVYSEIHPASKSLEWICAWRPNGIILSGGPSSVTDVGAPTVNRALLDVAPLLGVCYGMQLIAHLEGAHSSEFDAEATNPVINLLPEQHDVVEMGGTMRLGLYPCRIDTDSLAHQLYGQEVIYERHRHRYEFNNAYRNLFIEQGYRVSGTSPDGRLVEIIELPSHTFFIATQFHPEFQSSPSNPHPLFTGFMAAALQHHHQQTHTATVPKELLIP